MIAGLLRGLVASPQDLGEELSEQIGKKESDRVGAACGEAAAERAGDILQLAGDLADFAAGVFIHRSDVVENARNGGGGNSCFPRNIANSRHDNSPELGVNVNGYTEEKKNLPAVV